LISSRCREGGVAEDLLEDAPVDGERGVVVPAVDIGRDDPLRLLPDHGKDPAGVAVVEVVGETICELKDVRISEKSPVAAEERRVRHRRDWRRGSR
jgi:hypothetical protein